MPLSALASTRAVLAITGADRVKFLQGLVSNDVAKATDARAIWCGFLTPQGKYLHDFFLVADGEALLLDVEAARAADLARRLKLFKLRSDATVAERADLCVGLLWGEGATNAAGLDEAAGTARALGGGVAFVDPRHGGAGVRVLLPVATAAATLSALAQPAAIDAWEALRLGLGLPDGSRDLEPEKALLLENGFDELGGIDWKKGCYMGQELTARTRYRGLVKKRLMPVAVEGPLPAPGTIIRLGEHEAGEMRSGLGSRALALLRLERLEERAAAGGVLTAGDATITPHRPTWMQS